MARSGAGKGVRSALQEAVGIPTASYEGVRLELSVPAQPAGQSSKIDRPFFPSILFI